MRSVAHWLVTNWLGQSFITAAAFGVPTALWARSKARLVEDIHYFIHNGSPRPRVRRRS